MAEPATPNEEIEWYLSGATPEKAIDQIEWHLARQTQEIRRLQVKQADYQKALRKLRKGEWPKDENGFLTVSPDNSL